MAPEATRRKPRENAFPYEVGVKGRCVDLAQNYNAITSKLTLIKGKPASLSQILAFAMKMA